jgi:hypothetical protein
VLRAAINWAADGEIISTKPYIPKLQGKDALKTRGRTLAYSLPQLAALIEAAWADERRHHIHLFILTMLGSHARTEAILECNLDAQYHDGVIDWLAPGREQTKKRRSITPVTPTLAAWLKGRTGKLIRYRVARSRREWPAPDQPVYFERDTWQIRRGWESNLLAAGARHPSLGLRQSVITEDGEETWQGLGTPNTLRHSIHTQLRRLGVPKPQIDAAAGHAEQGTGDRYSHFDALHDLKDFAAGIEALFEELTTLTKCHLRSHHGPKIHRIPARAATTSS